MTAGRDRAGQPAGFYIVLCSIICFCAGMASGAYFGVRVFDQSQSTTQVYFSPKGGCTEHAVKEIDAAKISIHCQAYSFSSKPIVESLERARNRGVQITIILDKSQQQEKYSALGKVASDGIPTYLDTKHAIAHNKIILIDGRTIITGSFNFTQQAESANAENMLVIRYNSTLYEQYEHNFQLHLAHATHYGN